MNIINPTHLRLSKGCLKTGPTSFTPELQSGMILIEALIAMFVLAVGVFALLVVQLRTVSNVCESENQTTVAQVTQNLTEGMLINPTLSEETDTAGDKTSRYKKSYDAYIISNSEQLRDPKQTSGFKEKMTRVQLTQAQIVQFKVDLAKALPEAQIFSTTYKDSFGAEPTYEKGLNAKCDGKGDTIIVKVSRLQDAEEENNAKNPNTSGHHVVYTCQPRIRD